MRSTFYLVTYRADGLPEGIGHAFFTQKREAEKFVKNLHEDDKRDTCPYCMGEVFAPKYWCNSCGLQIAHESYNPEIRTLIFEGTPHQVARKCLEYQVV